MANQPQVPPQQKTDKPQKEEITPEWKEILYAPERVEKWIRGEITLAELSAVNGPEMLEMAVVGFQMYEQGRYDHAKVIFQGLAGMDPKEGYYRTALGAVYLAQDQLDEALELFNSAIELDDKEVASYVNRGEVFLRQGKIVEAAHDFKKAVDLDPENKDPLSQRARVLAAAALETLEAAQQPANSTPSKPAAQGSGAASKPASKPGAPSARQSSTGGKGAPPKKK